MPIQFAFEPETKIQNFLKLGSYKKLGKTGEYNSHKKIPFRTYT